MPKLTKTYIDKLTAPADKEAFHWDTEIKGFGLRVTPTGKITYIVQGRVNGSSPRISIGPHGVFTVDQAREVAREHLRSMRMGIDPRAIAKKEAAQRVTLRDVADAYKRAPPTTTAPPYGVSLRMRGRVVGGLPADPVELAPGVELAGHVVLVPAVVSGGSFRVLDRCCRVRVQPRPDGSAQPAILRTLHAVLLDTLHL